MTQFMNEAAALLFLLTFSMDKSGSATAVVSLVTVALDRVVGSRFSILYYSWLGLLINFLAVGQSCFSPRMRQTRERTCYTVFGGELKALSSVIDFLSMRLAAS